MSSQNFASSAALQRPLVVDLDGTLVYTDMLYESALLWCATHPAQSWRIATTLVQGKAVLKQFLAAGVHFDVQALPYNPDLLNWLQQEKAAGRKLVLCTASDRHIAEAIAKHLGIFDEVLASDGQRNLAGAEKARVLVQHYGERGFDYAGNSRADLAVWPHAAQAVVVNASAGVQASAAACAAIAQVFPPPERSFGTWRRMLRLHQWLKNVLLFVPLAAGHQLFQASSWWQLAWAFVAFSLCASAVYLTNDLLDLENDRQHPRKRLRPMAAGVVPVAYGVVLAPVLLGVSWVIGRAVGPDFLAVLGVYFILTCAYSWRLKKLLLVDCMVLALLYTLRVVAGAAAVGLALSFWLLAFSVFLFLSLAFVKRYAELEVQIRLGKEKIQGRDYHTTDAPLLQTMGISSGYAAGLVLALYLNSDAVVRLYRTPAMIWGAVPVLLFWVSWMWMQAHRGLMHDDPLVYAVKDKTSLVCGLIFAAMLVLGAVGVSW